MSWLSAIFSGISVVLAIWLFWLFGLEMIYGGFQQFFNRNTNHKPWAIMALILSALTLATLVMKGVVLK